MLQSVVARKALYCTMQTGRRPHVCITLLQNLHIRTVIITTRFVYRHWFGIAGSRFLEAYRESVAIADMSSPPTPVPPVLTTEQHSAYSQAARPVTTAGSTDADPNPDTVLEDTWKSVKLRLSTVFQNMHNDVRIYPTEWVKLYSDVSTLCIPDDDMRKRRMYVHVRDFIRELVESQLKILRKYSGPALLAQYNQRWNTAIIFVRFMKRVSHPLHRYWIPGNANIQKEDPIRPIDNLLMFYWREILLTNLHSIVDVALALVDEDRCGMPVNRGLIRGLVENLVTIGAADVLAASETPTSFNSTGQKKMHCQSTLHLYQQLFEEPFLAATVNFYRRHGDVYVDPDNVSAFMKKILSRLEREEERAREILHRDSVQRVRQAAQEQLIGNQIEYLQKEASRMISNGKHSDLHVVYSLLKRVEDGLTPVRTFFVRFVRSEGNSIVVNHVRALNGKEDILHNLELIEKLIQLHVKHATMVQECFERSPILMMAIDDAFRGFVNRTVGPISLPNLLAHYIDHLLRSKRTPKMIHRPIRNSSDAEEAEVSSKDDVKKQGASNSEEEWDTDDYITELVRFFMYLDEKDVFCEIHRNLFAKRLLTNYNENLEMLFTSHLEVQMGGIYTQRFKGMLQDVKTSSTLRLKFRSYLRKQREKVINVLKEDSSNEEQSVLLNAFAIDISVHVLNTLHWPSSKEIDLVVPREITKCHELFTEFYMQDRQSRRLTWTQSMSTLTMVANFGNRSYSLVTSVAQACILMLFNSIDEIDVDELAKRINLSDEDVMVQVKPLLYGRRSRLLKVIERECNPSTSAEDTPTAQYDVGMKRAIERNDKNESERTRKRARTTIIETGEKVDDESEDEEEGCTETEKQSNESATVVVKRIGVNLEFRGKNNRVFVPMGQVQVCSTEAVVSQKHIVVDRSTQVDAAIVRIMKSKRQATHVEVCGYVMSVFSDMFVPDPRLIKLRIERLIEMEYITRDADDTRVYRYSA